MSDAPIPIPNPQVLFTEIDDGSGVLLHLDTKFYYTLNPTAVAVWKALGEGVAMDVIAGRLAAEFLVTPEVARRDVVTVLDDLLAEGLVTAR
jgi:Coenzyme PQQ synthesis protein D (PqqD)